MDSFICVCSANYCDQIEETGTLADGQMVYFLTSRDQHRLTRFQIQDGNQCIFLLFSPNNFKKNIKEGNNLKQNLIKNHFSDPS